jgi:NAD(P)-dependent dehydrogenase (short-subunit alcohol dehydrogenase family)
LADRGAHLIIHYNSDGSAQRTEELAKSLKERFSIVTIKVKADLGSSDGPEQLIHTACEFWNDIGDQLPFRLDFVINNAGVSVNRPISECDAEDFAFQYNVNVRGPLLLMKAAMPYLPKDRSGRIVNISSVSSSLGFVGQSVYGGTKAALEAMTRTWARELSERATVNAVNPGPVETDMYGGTASDFQKRMIPFLQNTPLSAVREGVDKPEHVANVGKTGGRPAQPEEIASLVGLLCSAGASFTTGSILNANGGMYMSF